jgi:hypothetical protein
VPLDDAVAAFNSTERRAGKTVIRVRPSHSAEPTGPYRGQGVT